MLNLTTNESAGIILLLAITIFVVGWLIYNKFKNRPKEEKWE